MPAFEPPYQDLVTMFRDAVLHHGPHPLFGVRRNDRWEWMTFAAFGQMVDACRAGLAQAGLGAGDRAAIISNNRIEWAAAAYATYGLGGAFVPMYQAQQPGEWEHILRDCGAKIVFCATPIIAERVNRMRAGLPAVTRIVCFDAPSADPDSFEALLSAGKSQPAPSITPDPDSVAAFIYTSGTTGIPKGVLLTHRNIASNVCAGGTLVPLSEKDRTLSFLPWTHSFGQVVELHLMIAHGVSMALCENVERIVDELPEVKPTILIAVPRVFNRIYGGVQRQIARQPQIIQTLFHIGMKAQSRLRRGEKLTVVERLCLPIARKLLFRKIVERFGGRLRFVVSGGAALSPQVGEFVENLGVTVLEGYGLSETSPMATGNTPGQRRIGSVGKPLPGITIRLDHDAAGGNIEEGEVIIAGHNVMKGYHNLPEETARVLTPDGGVRSGDMGKIDRDGFLYITGRIKELYKLENGKYVAPAVLEEKLQLSPLIAQAMVYGANRPFNIAIVVPDFANLKEWAQREGIEAANLPRLLEQPKTRALIRSEIQKYSTEFKGFEAIREFLVAKEEFSIANDMLTPKLSMKRRNVEKAYGAQIESLYANAANGRRETPAETSPVGFPARMPEGPGAHA